MKNIIIGAGPAGITAAYKLSSKSEVEVFERFDRVGGISATEDFEGNKLDLGPHRFYTKSEKVLNFWKEMLPLQGKPAIDDIELNHDLLPFSDKPDAPDPEQEDAVLLHRRRITRIYYRKKFFDYPVNLSFNTIKGLGLINMVKIGFTYFWALLFKKPETSLENFFINRFGSHLYRTFFKDYTEKLWGIKCDELSAEWGSQRVKGISVSKILKEILGKMFLRNKFKTKETSLIESFYFPKLGAGQMYEQIAEKAKTNGTKINLSTNVEKIKLAGNKVYSIVVNKDGKKHEVVGDNFISSMAISDLIGKMDGNVPEKVKKAAKGLLYRNVRLAAFLFNNLKIKNTTKVNNYNNLIPDVWIYIQEKNIFAGRMEVINNFSPYLVKDNKNQVCVTVEYFCSDGDKFWTMSDEEFCNFALSELVKMDIVEENSALSHKAYRVEKAYPVYFGGYKDFDILKDFINSISNLYPIGRNGMHKYNNMDHSILTGMETADCILTGSPDKKSVWKVNTEKEYQG